MTVRKGKTVLITGALAGIGRAAASVCGPLNVPAVAVMSIIAALIFPGIFRLALMLILIARHTDHFVKATFSVIAP